MKLRQLKEFFIKQSYTEDLRINNFVIKAFTHLRQIFHPYRNQLIDLLCSSTEGFQKALKIKKIIILQFHCYSKYLKKYSHFGNE